MNFTSDIEILLEISLTIVDNCLVLGWHNGDTCWVRETQPSRVVHIDDTNIDSHGRQKKAHNMSPQLTVRILDKNVGFSFNITPLPASDKNWKSKQFYSTQFSCSEMIHIIPVNAN